MVQKTSAPAGVAIGTAATTVYTNPANSGEVRTVQVQFVNVDGAVDVDLTSVEFVDASPAGAFRILPANYTLKAKTGLVSFLKVLEPGDSVRGTASAAGDVVAVADVVLAELVR